VAVISVLGSAIKHNYTWLVHALPMMKAQWILQPQHVVLLAGGGIGKLECFALEYSEQAVRATIGKAAALSSFCSIH
jgi:hypothetical protein